MKKEKKEIGITAEKDDFSDWFSQLMIKADLADYSDVSGCIVFKPSSYSIWEKIQGEIDKRLKKLGVKNAYFPLLIPEKFLLKEKEHVKGFSPEVAWVTETGNTKLAERLAIRPTSEAIMYPSYSKWIRSWRDLPFKFNLWNNVVRWEFSHPVPFLRTREFLWNELHTACASEKEALDEGKKVMAAYNEVTENIMALYGMYGRKTEKEKFAGAVFSEKIHYILPNGKAIEGCPFHHDGQNFAKAYDIKFIDKNEKESYVWQNTYAISTRMLGVMFAIHSDDKGLMLPPKLAPNQIVIVPILFDDTKNKVLKKAKEIAGKLKKFDAFVDERDGYNPGFKFNDWEMKGIPLRLEFGPKDLKNNQVIAVRRDNGKKEIIKIAKLEKKAGVILDDMQKELFKRSENLFKSKVEKAETLSALKKTIDNKKVGIVTLCTKESCEDMMKFEIKGAKALFISNEKLKKGTKCIICSKPAIYYVYAGKSY